MVPPKASGKIKSIKSGDFNVTETVCTLEDGTEIKMMQEWPVRHPRPFSQKYAPDTPLVTGMRILDFLFPLQRVEQLAFPVHSALEKRSLNNLWRSTPMPNWWSTSVVESVATR